MAGAARSRAGAVRTITRSARGSRARTPATRVKKGIGFATFMHGAGFTGSGEEHLASVVAVEGTAEGRVRVLASCTEIGQGTNTIFSQIAADALGIDCADIEIVAARHRRRARQRPDGRVAHVHGRRQARRDGGARRRSMRSIDAGYLPAPYTRAEFRPRAALRRRVRLAARDQPVPAAARACAGTTRRTRRRVRHVRLGRVRRRGHGRYCRRGRRGSTISSPCRRSAR